MLRPKAKIKATNEASTTSDPSDEKVGKRQSHALTIVVVLALIGSIVWVAKSRQANSDRSNVEPKSLKSSSNQLRRNQVRESVGAESKKETLVLSTKVGDLRIVFRPDLAPESVDYVKQVVQDGACSPCNLYRVEKPGILQGILKSPHIPITTVKGACPKDAEHVPNNCPPHDSTCGCHGPVMTRGMVGWAAGKTGPDFFVDDYRRPAMWWGTQHTVWGEIQDEASLAVIDVIWTLPSKKQTLTYLVEPLHFDLRIE